MNEQELCKKRLIDLSKQANRKGIVLFSDFLNLNELNIYHQCKKLFETKTNSYGGIDYAERQMIAFLPDALSYEWKYPISVLQINPRRPKFAEKLGHRDILGSIMQLGIDRGKLGDILLQEDTYYLICEKSVASYFAENLTQIRHTAVYLTETECKDIQIEQNLIEKEGTVTSNRLDAVIACVYHMSRSQSLALIRAEKVFINGALSLNPSLALNGDEIISVRGKGRFHYNGVYGQSQKGRLKFKYKIYGD